MGPSTVLVTSVLRPDRPADTIEMLAVHGDEALDRPDASVADEANGSGDVTAALFTAHLLNSGPDEALAKTVSSVYALLKRTLDSGAGAATGAEPGRDRPPGHGFVPTRVR